jgi:hypothetical protein
MSTSTRRCIDNGISSNGWSDGTKEYRGLGARHEKLAVNYVALWSIAMIERALKRLYPNRP